MLKYAADVEQLVVVLASQSPRRRVLLQLLGIHNPQVIPSAFPETLPKAAFPDATAYCAATTALKMNDIWASKAVLSLPRVPHVLIGADTVVVAPDGTIFEKAQSPEEAAEMLRQLSGRRSQVITTLMVLLPASVGEAHVDPGDSIDTTFIDAIGGHSCSEEFLKQRKRTHVEQTWVTFGEIDEEEIAAYVRHPSAWQGKAGAYGIQDLAAQYIRGIEGDYYTVMGLPVHALANILADSFRKGWLRSSEKSNDYLGMAFFLLAVDYVAVNFLVLMNSER